MIERGRPGLIINTGSKQGITTPPGNPAYNVSKAGVKAFTEALQHELRNTEGARISAHLLIPGFVFTGLTANGRTEKPAGAWTPEQTVDFMIERLEAGDFYILCPDNDVPRQPRRAADPVGGGGYRREPPAAVALASGLCARRFAAFAEGQVTMLKRALIVTSVSCLWPHSLQANFTRVSPFGAETRFGAPHFPQVASMRVLPCLTTSGLAFHGFADQALGLFAHRLLRHSLAPVMKSTGAAL